MADSHRSAALPPTTTEGHPDVQHDVLADNLCRDTLAYLGEQSPAIPLRAIAAHVSDAPPGPLHPPADPTDTTNPTYQTAIELHHYHLPKLARYGLIHYTPDTRRVEQVSIPPQLLEVLDRADDAATE